MDIPGDWLDYAWSPDSSRILALSRTKLEVFDGNGKPIGAVDVPQRTDGANSVSSPSIRTWTADSARAAMFVNEHLLLIDRNGHGQAIDPASSGLDISGAGFQFIGWSDSTHIRAITPSLSARTLHPPPRRLHRRVSKSPCAEATSPGG